MSALYALCVMGLGRDTGRFDIVSMREMGTVAVMAHGGEESARICSISARISRPNCCVSAESREVPNAWVSARLRMGWLDGCCRDVLALKSCPRSQLWA